MVKKIPSVILFLSLSVFNLLSQSSVYDILSYSAPLGWTISDNPGHRSYTLIDNQKGTYGMIVIYPSIKSSGDAVKDFDQSWNELVKTTFGAGERPEITRNERADGYSVLVSGTESKIKGKSTIVLLVDFTGYGKTVSVILNYSDDSYSPYVTSFLGSIKFNNVVQDQQVKSNVVTSPSEQAGSDIDLLAPTRANIGNTGTASLIGSEGVSGLWMSMIAQVNFAGGSSTDLKVITVFSNGEMRENLPLQGYRYFDIAQDKKLYPNNWGRYKGGNGVWSVEKNGAALYRGKLSLRESGKIEFDGDSYIRIKPFNNLKLKGGWSSVANPDETVVIDGLEPLIYFSEDGRFVDKGILMALDMTTSRSNQGAGKGNYEISDYTLSLHYDDGRIRNYSIVGLFNSPAVSDKTLVVGNVTLRKRQK